MIAVHYKPTHDRLEHMDEHGIAKEKDKGILKKNWIEYVELHLKITGHRPPFLEMLDELESLCDGYLRLINAPKRHIYILNDDVRALHSDLYWARPITRTLSGAQIGWMISKKWGNRRLRNERPGLSLPLEEGLSSLQCRLTEAICDHHPWFVPLLCHGGLYWRIWRGNRVFSVKLQLGVLADGYIPERLRQDGIQAPPWPVKVHQNTVGAKNVPSIF